MAILDLTCVLYNVDVSPEVLALGLLYANHPTKLFVCWQFTTLSGERVSGMRIMVSI